MKLASSAGTSKIIWMPGLRPRRLFLQAYIAGERAAVENRLRTANVGSDVTVQAGLEKMVSDTRADEVIVVTDTYEHSDRIDSYQRVARIASKIKSAPKVAELSS